MVGQGTVPQLAAPPLAPTIRATGGVDATGMYVPDAEGSEGKTPAHQYGAGAIHDRTDAEGATESQQYADPPVVIPHV